MMRNEWDLADLENKGLKEDEPHGYLVRGCGVTFLCASGRSMQEWIEYIVFRGGVPEVERV